MNPTNPAASFGQLRAIWRRALTRGAEILRRRGGTKQETDRFAAMECENCAAVLERLAGRPGAELNPTDFYAVLNAAMRDVEAWWPTDEVATPATVLASLGLFAAEFGKDHADDERPSRRSISRRAGDAEFHGRYYRDQVDQLAACVMKHFPDEPGSTGQSEGAVDVAIRLIERLKAATA